MSITPSISANTASILAIIPAVIIGYILFNAKLTQRLWQTQRESDRYFRILILGYLWILFFNIFFNSLNDELNALMNYSAGVKQINPAAIIAAVIVRSGADSLYEILVRFSQKIKDDFYINGIFAYHPLEAELYKRSVLGRFSMVTLKSGKVYIGYIINLGKEPNINWINVVPFRSGYRDETGELHLTTDYADALKAAEEQFFLKNSDFNAPPSIINQNENFSNVTILLPVKDIISLQHFDPALYPAFFEL